MNSSPNSEKQVNICLLFALVDRNEARVLEQATRFRMIVNLSGPRTHASLFLTLRSYGHPSASAFMHCSCPNLPAEN